MQNLLQKYNDIMNKIEPESAIGYAFFATGAPIKYPIEDNATIINWSNSGIEYAKNKDSEHVAEFDSLIKAAMENATISGMNKELSTLYLTAHDFQVAEVNLQAVANITQKTITKENHSKIKSFINRFYDSLEGGVKRITGRITDNLKSLKQNVEDLKDSLKSSVSKIKEKFINAFNSILDTFFSIINESINRIFSFIDMINVVAEKKGYRLKTLNISFDPPTFEKASVLGIPMPLPKISLPKADIGFEKIEVTNK